MNITYAKHLFILIILICSQLTHAITLQFKPTKTGGWSLRTDFLQELHDIFKTDVFIESGTSYGTTARNAKDIFNEVHTIELEESFFTKAKQNFSSCSFVHVYHGDSGDLMPAILEKVKKRNILFWLDGHFSGGTTARGVGNTPIMKELAAIEKSGIRNGIILIDDMCCFSPEIKAVPDVAQGYPSMDQLRQALLKINPGYELILYGDILIAYPSTFQVQVSPLIQAMTVSRFFTQDAVSYEQVFDAEGIIASQTTPQELEALWDQCTYHFGEHRTYPYLWYALSLFSQERYAEAYDNFMIVRETGYTDWRVTWYTMQAAYRSGKSFKDLAQELWKQKYNLVAAQLFLKRIG